ncbi:MAG: diguanylate cyclase [Ruminococcus sp.]|nr:diguanylate cyclase [Ruminococcus sp.]
MENKKKKINIPTLIIFTAILIGVNIFQRYYTAQPNETVQGIIDAFHGLVERYGIGPDKGPVEGPLNGLLHTGANAVNGVLAQVGLIAAVALVLTNGLVGLIIGGSINMVAGISTLIVTVIIKGQTQALPSFFIGLASTAVLIIIYVYKVRNEKAHEQLRDSYEQVIENNRIIKEKDEVLSYLAYYDRLTQMPNRQLFLDNLEENAKNGVDCFVLYIDIDNFRTINEGYGHSTGDELLKEYAKRIEAIVRENDFVAKIGGDEFGIIFLAGSTNEDVINCVSAIQQAFQEPVVVRGDSFSVTASYGAAHFPVDARSSEDIFRCAETAMFASKTNGKNQLSFFSRGE